MYDMTARRGRRARRLVLVLSLCTALFIAAGCTKASRCTNSCVNDLIVLLE